jgi:hypothetical protein
MLRNKIHVGLGLVCVVIKGGDAICFLVYKFTKFLGLFRFSKSRNFLGSLMRKSQIRKFLCLIRKSKICKFSMYNSQIRKFSLFNSQIANSQIS